MNPAVPTSADLVVIGGGIIGLATAYEAARQGMSAVRREPRDLVEAIRSGSVPPILAPFQVARSAGAAEGRVSV